MTPVCLFLCAQAFRDSPEEQEKTHTASGGPNSRTRFYDSYSTVRRPDRSTKINVSLDALVQGNFTIELTYKHLDHMVGGIF